MIGASTPREKRSVSPEPTPAPNSTPSPARSAPPPGPLGTPKEEVRVVVRAYPKIVFFWITWIAFGNISMLPP